MTIEPDRASIPCEPLRDAGDDRFRVALEAAPTGMVMIDARGRIVLVNAQVERLFGYSREELVGKMIETLVPMRSRGRHPDFRGTFQDEPRARLMGEGRELYGLRKDGTEVPIEIGLNPVRMDDEEFVLSSVVDITERRRAEREREELFGQLRSLNAELEERVRARTSELTALLKEREILLQEVHHRVKNNLQVISSLINMQVQTLGRCTERVALEECQTRVLAIALIHEKLYQSTDYARVPFAKYVRSLVSSVFCATGVCENAIRPELAIEDLSLAVDKAIPCGLVLNELITNAVKHAFPNGRGGSLRVALARVGTRLHLAVEDDGVGLPEGFDLRRSDSLGLRLVCMLAEQLDATVEAASEAGARFRMSFEAEG